LNVREQVIDLLVDFCSSFAGNVARCARGGPVEIISRSFHWVPPLVLLQTGGVSEELIVTTLFP
jgi:hypothetical protein